MPVALSTPGLLVDARHGRWSRATARDLLSEWAQPAKRGRVDKLAKSAHPTYHPRERSRLHVDKAKKQKQQRVRRGRAAPLSARCSIPAAPHQAAAHKECGQACGVLRLLRGAQVQRQRRRQRLCPVGSPPPPPAHDATLAGVCVCVHTLLNNFACGLVAEADRAVVLRVDTLL